MASKQLVDPTYAQGREGYASDIAEIEQAGVCPFCPKNFKWHTRRILQRKGAWIITRNAHPYANAKHHFLIIGDRHIESLVELTAEDWENVKALVAWATERYKMKGGGLLVRFGETRFTGATVVHLHFHLIQPKLGKNRRAVPVWFPIG